ncbi:TetR/AcrR family transcriptional regulator [Cystobacter fuscus]
MDTRGAIIDHAVRLFAERGYDAIGVQEICEAAGITKPTLYHHFGNKRGLFEALIQERCQPFLETLRRAADYAGDLPRSLQQVTLAYFEFARREPTLYRLLLMFWFMRPSDEAFQRVAEFNEKQHQLLVEMFREAQKGHGNLKGRQQAHAATLLGTLNTYIVMSLNGHVELNEHLAHRAMHQFSHGIYS